MTRHPGFHRRRQQQLTQPGKNSPDLYWGFSPDCAVFGSLPILAALADDALSNQTRLASLAGLDSADLQRGAAMPIAPSCA